MKEQSPKLRRHVALCDVHVPHNINLSPVYSYLKAYKPTDFILNGDFLNLEWASHWNEKEFKQIGLEKLGSMLRQELAAGEKVMAELNAALPVDCVKYYVPGNHEDWLYFACLMFPSLAGGVTLGVERMTFKSDLAKIRKQVLADLLRNLLHTDKYGFKVLPFGEELTLGKITYIHGHQVSSLAAARRKFPARNIVMGHHHTHQVETLHNSGNKRTANQYVMVPCLCGLAPGYLNDSSTRWLNGFWAADMLPSGLFDGKVIKVVDGAVLHDGKIYR